MSNPETDLNPFQTLNEDGTPVQRRISSPASVRHIFARFVDEDAIEAGRRAKLLNMYNCNLPYDPDKLKKLNLGNIANFNTGDLKGFIDGRVSAIANLALDVTPLVELRPVPGDKAGPQAEEFAEVIADEFSSTVRDGKRLLPCLSSMFRECDLMGLGPVTWTSRIDYTPVPLRRGQIKFRADGPIESSDHELFMFETYVPIHYFSRVFYHADAAAKEGWDTKAVIEYLVDVFVHEKQVEADASDSTSTSPMESSLIEMRQNRWLEKSQFRTIKVIHSFIKEVDGKIRHCISTPVAGVERFLYDREAAYDKMEQCFMWMPASVVELEARGSRGVASYMAPICDINNRLMCQMYDIGFRTGNITLVSGSPSQHRQASIIERGPYTVVSSELEFPAHPHAPGTALQQLASLRETGSNIGLNNAMGVRGGPATASERMASGSDRKTKEEVQAIEQAKASGEQSLFAARTLALDSVFRETFRRFASLVSGPAATRSDYPEVKAFMDRCILRGVPEAALKNMDEIFTVYTNRVLVTGGGDAHAAVLSGLLSQFGGAFDEKGRVMAMRDIVRYKLGTKGADRYRPVGNRDSAPSNATSIAALENIAMQNRGQAVVGHDQFHWTHIPVHMGVLGQVVEQYQKDPESIQEPQMMLDIMQLVSNHVKGHLEFGALQPGMNEFAKQVSKQLSSLAPVVKGLTMMAGKVERQRAAEAEKQQRERAQLEEQARGNDARVAMHESDNKARLMEREQDLIHQARMKKVMQDGEIALRKAENETKANIARQTERVVQGSEILGRSSSPIPESGVPASPFPVGDEDGLTGDEQMYQQQEY